MQLRYGTNTHLGRRRTNNQDDLLVLPEENLFVVADGMGGHAAGELASSLCVQTIRESFENTAGRPSASWSHPPEPGQDPYITRLVASIQLAHHKILDTMRTNSKLRGMGTTVVAAWFTAERVFIAHVGDSRCYRLRGNELTQLTRDHSLVNAIKERFELSPAQRTKIEDMSHVLVRALGVEDDAYADVDVTVLTPDSGDTFLLCSDGLTDEVRDPELLSILAREETPGRAAARLIRRANDHGGRDNITAIVMEFEEVGGDDEDTMLLDEETVDMTTEWFDDDPETTLDDESGNRA